MIFLTKLCNYKKLDILESNQDSKYGTVFLHHVGFFRRAQSKIDNWLILAQFVWHGNSPICKLFCKFCLPNFMKTEQGLLKCNSIKRVYAGALKTICGYLSDCFCKPLQNHNESLYSHFSGAYVSNAEEEKL